MNTKLLIIVGIFLILIGFTTMIMPNVLASENLFYGTSSLEKFPSAIVPDNSQIIEIKFQYQDGSYSLSNFEPIFDIHPAEAVPYVHIEFEPVDGIVRNSIARIHGTITVDPNIPSEKIFLNISYVGTYSIEPPVNFKSGWNDSAIIDIRENLSGGRLDKIVFSMPSPLKQFKSGISIDKIQCRDNLQLILKTSNNSPACVKPESIPKLIERGWVENSSSKISESQSTQLSDVGLQVDVTGQQQVRRGTTHDITVDVTRNGNPISDSLVIITIEDYGKDIIRKFEGQTDDSGRFVFSWEIPKSFDDIETLLAYVDVTDDISAKTVLFKFQVYCLPGESGCKVEGN